ncbi:MAG: hypothetical protein KJ749_01460, partial [Planctomycetes bacterium]|nr:hypothetical protein [Planctomycetota bacterium]
MKRWSMRAALAAWCLAAQTNAAMLESKSVRLEVGDDGKLTSLKVAGVDRELARPDQSLATARVGDKWLRCSAAAAQGQNLVLQFGDSGITAQLAWEAQDEMLLITLSSVQGAPEELQWLNLAVVDGSDCRGGGHALVYSDASVVLIAEQPECRIRGAGHKRAYLAASVESRLTLAPVRVALVGTAGDDPTSRIAAVEALFGIPVGMKAKLGDAARGSYLMLGGVSQANIDTVVDWGRRGGFGSVLFIHGCWAHYGHRYAVPAGTFPGGIGVLKEAVDKVHAAGMLAGA